MAEITLVGVKYTTIDDKTAMASISEKRGTFIILKKVKIDGKEYTVTKVGHLDINYGRITVSIPDSVTSIGNMSDCSNITIPDSVTSIGDMVRCSNITIPDSVTSIGDMVRCSNMKINFHNGIKSLNKISGLNGITIPDSVTSIGDMEHCSNITIPDSVTSIGKLYNCSNITILDSVTSIGELRSCSNITIPDSVTSIGNMVRCSNMKINFHNGIKSLNKISGLNGITIPDSVTSIGDMEHCSNITIPDSVTSIGDMEHCSNITIPDHITSIRGVRYCYNITIPDSITSISRIHCGTLIIPASVATINEISGENGSLMLMMESTTPPTLAKAIYLTKDDTLTVPVGAAEAYKNHPMWGKFKNISERNIPAPSASTNTKKVEPKVAPKAEPKKETPKPEVRRPSADDMNVLDRLIDAALEDFVLTDEERSVLLKKSKEIGLGEDEFKIYLNGKIQERMKDKPAEKVEEKKKGFFARLFG